MQSYIRLRGAFINTYLHEVRQMIKVEFICDKCKSTEVIQYRREEGYIDLNVWPFGWICDDMLLCVPCRREWRVDID